MTLHRMGYFSAVVVALLAVSSGAQQPREDCASDTFKISGKFFSTRIIASYRDQFPKYISFAERNYGLGVQHTHFHHTDDIIDAEGNRFYMARFKKAVYVYIKCYNKHYRTEPYLNDATYAMSKDRRMVFIAIKKGGPLYVFETNKPEVKNHKVILKVIEEVGSSVTSVSVDPNTGDIAIGRREGIGGYVLLINELENNPCNTVKVAPSNAEQALKINFINLMTNMGCHDRYLMAYSQDDIDRCLLMKSFAYTMNEKITEIIETCPERNNDESIVPTEKTTTRVEEIDTVSDTLCNVEKDKITALIKKTERQKNITDDARQMLDTITNGSDKIGQLYNFEEMDVSVKGDMIDQYSLRNYNCLPKADWRAAEKNKIMVREQAKYLMLGLEIISNTLQGKEEEYLNVAPE